MRRQPLVKEHTIKLYAALCDVVGSDGVYNPSGILVDNLVECCSSYWGFCKLGYDGSSEVNEHHKRCKIAGKRENIISIITEILKEKHSDYCSNNLVSNVDVAIHAQIILEDIKTVSIRQDAI